MRSKIHRNDSSLRREGRNTIAINVIPDTGSFRLIESLYGISTADDNNGGSLLLSSRAFLRVQRSNGNTYSFHRGEEKRHRGGGP